MHETDLSHAYAVADVRERFRSQVKSWDVVSRLTRDALGGVRR